MLNLRILVHRIYIFLEMFKKKINNVILMNTLTYQYQITTYICCSSLTNVLKSVLHPGIMSVHRQYPPL